MTYGVKHIDMPSSPYDPLPATHTSLRYLCLALVGVGSTLYHASLTWEMQLADEVPMLWCCASFIFNLQSTRLTTGKRGSAFICSLLLVCSVVTWSYLDHKHPIFFEVTFGLQAFFAFVQLGWLAHSHHESRGFTRVFWVSFLSFLGAFIVWLIDNFFCVQLRALRDILGPFGVVTQLHAWWHVGTGYSSYLHIVLRSVQNKNIRLTLTRHHSSMLRCEALGLAYQLRRRFGLPYVQVLDKSE